MNTYVFDTKKGYAVAQHEGTNGVALCRQHIRNANSLFGAANSCVIVQGSLALKQIKSALKKGESLRIAGDLFLHESIK